MNECIEKLYRVHLLSSEYNHHIYAKDPALSSSFHELYDKAYHVGISAIPLM